MNILIVGLGSIARKHIDAINSLKLNATIYALRSSINVVQESGVVNIFDIDSLDKTIDFAIISNPTYFHFKSIESLANKNIPLFIEKPPIHSLENSLELIKFVESKKIITYTACNLRFHPCLLFVNDFLKSNSDRIEEVNVYCGSYLPDWRPGKVFKEIYSANANMGGGVHLDLFHELDYTTWIFGFPNKINSIRRNVSSLAIDAIDYANYSLEYNNFTANIVLNYYRKKPKRIIEVVLSNRIILVDLINNLVIDDQNDTLFEVQDFDMKSTYFKQMEYFVSCISNNIQPMNSLKESIDVLNIVLQNA
jgi:predicted dehydrogenase